ncbi:MAG: hypothetical protein ACAI43_22745 [Phycisphaerae bacterium]|nr:hypothetical protein [Tepidisphaeraceae bacterium]
MQTMTMRMSAGVLGLMMWVAGGCTDQPNMIPSPDADLRRTNAQFAADAAKRTYPGDAPRGGEAQAQAEVDHGFLNRIQVINLSAEDWDECELWVNQTYVVHLKKWAPKQMKIVTFNMLFDNQAQTFPTNNAKVRVAKVELARGGKVYDIPLKLAD